MLRIVLCLALIAAPFFPPKAGHAKGGIWYATYAVVGAGVILFGLLYWFVWFKLIPKWKGYRVEEGTDVLSDGTTVSTLIHMAS
jgi:hypothetical protein